MHVLMVAVAPPYHQEYMQHFHSMEDNRLIWLLRSRLVKAVRIPLNDLGKRLSEG